ncbi:MAG: cytoplasmic protein [Candidatus Eremiobacteraeota bacterium]|nr:cytoplasmic protein [Candidatus Eremiobacteraeota bacterium]
MPRQFVSQPLQAIGATFDPATMSRGEPALPTAFQWNEERLNIQTLLRTWRSTKTDRGDVYLARHWFEVQLDDGRRAMIYFERQARGNAPRWWLYTIETT